MPSEKAVVDPWEHGYCQIYALAYWKAVEAIPIGCFGHSLPFFQKRWNWSKPKVQRFFDRLVKEGIVERLTRRGNQPMITRVLAHGEHYERDTSRATPHMSASPVESRRLSGVSNDSDSPLEHLLDTAVDTKRTNNFATREVADNQVAENCAQCGRAISGSAVAHTGRCGTCETRSAARGFRRPASLDDNGHASDHEEHDSPDATAAIRGDRLRIEAPEGALRPEVTRRLWKQKANLDALLFTSPCIRCGRFSFKSATICYWCQREPSDECRALTASSTTLDCPVDHRHPGGLPSDPDSGTVLGSVRFEVAEEMGRASSTVRRWLIDGALRGYKLNDRDWRVTRSALGEFVNAQGEAPATTERERNGVDISDWRKSLGNGATREN